VLLAITQPIRIGDLVTFEEETGVVEDVRLAYTYIRADDGRRLIVPNERLAQSTIANHTIVDPRVMVAVDLWVSPGGDPMGALRALEDEGYDVAVAEVGKDGVRLSVGAWAETSAERIPLAARLRAECLERLDRDGLGLLREGPPLAPVAPDESRRPAAPAR
jgi:small-conductance mechanosensitive channel